MTLRSYDPPVIIEEASLFPRIFYMKRRIHMSEVNVNCVYYIMYMVYREQVYLNIYTVFKNQISEVNRLLYYAKVHG